jgi:hypothetical protein
MALPGAVLIGALAAGGIPFAACSHVNTTPPSMGVGPDARNYCAIAGACMLTPDFGFGECINSIAREQITLAPYGGDVGAQARYDCVKAAGTDCAKAALCIGRIQTNDPRCADPNAVTWPSQLPSFCNGDRITVCSGGGAASQSFLCGDDFAQQHFGGPQCVANAQSSALCGFASCGDGGQPASCEGNTLVYCTNGVLQRTLCSELGGTCDATAGKCSMTCSSAGYECNGTELLEDCAAGNKLPLYDCSARPGWTCRAPMDSVTFGCVPPDNECQWGVYQASCVNGSQVQYCEDGKISVYDCHDSGASKCVSSPGGVTCSF